MARRMNRRQFAVSSMGIAAGGAALAQPRGANDRIRVGVAGIRGRGGELARWFAERPDVEVAYLCDVDSRLFPERVKEIAGICSREPRCVQDVRVVLDDREVDALVVATPDHWHALQTIWACQAGKDVYLEKPVAHNIREGRKMVEAARKYGRVVQVGTQTRSAEYLYLAKEAIKNGDLGEIHLVRVLNSKVRPTIGHTPEEPVPPGVDYDMWLGPAPLRPFSMNHFHYSWHWFWAYSGGDIINDGVHQIDLARWLAGVTVPVSVSSTGGIHHFRDEQETPDTHVVNWDFRGLTMIFEQSLWSPYLKKMPIALRDLDDLPKWPFSGTRIELYGTRQIMFFERHGGGWQTFDADGNSTRVEPGRFTNREHIANFLDCMRSRATPVADIEEGHLSTLLCHYGNIAYRCGRKLAIDPETQGFPDDDEAAALVSRTYRAPWILPDQV